MGGIDEDDVAGGQRAEQIQVALFDQLALDLDAEVLQPRIFERLITNLPARIAAVFRLQILDGEMGNDRGLSAADLDDGARLEVPDHAIKRLGITRTAIAVRIGESSPVAATPFERSQCRAEVELRQQLQLRIEIPIDAGKIPGGIRVAEDMLGAVGRLVVV